MRGLIDSFDGAFLKLAESQHALDAGTIPLDQFLATTKLFLFGTLNCPEFRLQKQFTDAKESARNP